MQKKTEKKKSGKKKSENTAQTVTGEKKLIKGENKTIFRNQIHIFLDIFIHK